jgi:hypothetical protein
VRRVNRYLKDIEGLNRWCIGVERRTREVDIVNEKADEEVVQRRLQETLKASVRFGKGCKMDKG